MNTQSQTWPLFHLTTPSGARLARRASPAQPGKATLVWFGGYGSDMDGGKAQATHAFADETGRGCERFDYRGHGHSSGVFAEGSISAWKDDALAVLDACGPGPLVFVGSSMGAWIALLCAIARPGRATGLVLIAPAPDFTERLMWDTFPNDVREAILSDGVWLRPNAYGEAPQPVTRALIEDGRTHLLLDAPIPVTAPVRILHGASDAEVPWRHGLGLVTALSSQDVTFTLIKGGDHRLSEPSDLQRMRATFEALCQEVERG